MNVARYWSPFGFLALAPAGFLIGGIWSFLLIAALPLALLAFDRLLGREARIDGLAPSLAHRLLPWLYIPLQLAAIAWAGLVIARPATPAVDAIGLTLSMGVAAGVFGFLAAHEMIHSHKVGERWLGLVMLAGLLDMQFSISHVQGHHRRPATFEDPATARRGEGVYAFVIRSVAGQAREAWAFERRRLERAGRAPWGLGNRMIVFALVEAAIVVGVGVFSLRALGFLLADAALAIFLLECFNYVAHYGLVRRRDADGRLEPLRPRHSWNTLNRMNNASLFNMGRHADHHRFSSRPYNELEALDGGATLPAGYAASLLLALIPPLWRRVMDPKVDAVMAAHPLNAPQAIGPGVATAA